MDWRGWIWEIDFFRRISYLPLPHSPLCMDTDMVALSPPALLCATFSVWRGRPRRRGAARKKVCVRKSATFCVFILGDTRKLWETGGRQSPGQNTSCKKEENFIFLGEIETLRFPLKSRPMLICLCVPAFLNCFVFSFFSGKSFFAPDPLMPASKFEFRK